MDTVLNADESGFLLEDVERRTILEAKALVQNKAFGIF